MNTNTHRPQRTFETIVVSNRDDLRKAMSHLSKIIAPGRLGDPFDGVPGGDVGFALVVDGRRTTFVPWGSSIVYEHSIDDRLSITTMTAADVERVLGKVTGGTTGKGEPKTYKKSPFEAGRIEDSNWFKIDGNEFGSRVTLAMPIPGIGVVMRCFVDPTGGHPLSDTLLIPGAGLRESFDAGGFRKWSIEQPRFPNGVNNEAGSVVRANGDVEVNPDYDPFADGLREALKVVAVIAEGEGDIDAAITKATEKDIGRLEACTKITEALMNRIKACTQKTFNDPPRAIGAVTSDV